MKLIVELNEKDVQLKLDEVLGARISQISDEYIQAKVAEVIDKKLDRVNVEKLVADAAQSLIKSIYGEPNSYHQKYGQLLRDEACKLLQERLTKKGFDQ